MSRIEEIAIAEAKLIVEYIKYTERQKDIERRGSVITGADAAYKKALRNLEKLIQE